MNKTYLILTALLITTSICFSDCATIVSRTSYPISVQTNPPGVQVSIMDKKGKEIFRGKSPTALRLNSGAGFFSRAEYQVRLYAKGYNERVIPITFKLNAWYFGNIVFGGFIGMLIIDPATGAMWKIDNNSGDIYETLTATTSSTKAPTLNIIDIKDVPADIKKDLVRIK